MQKIQVVRVQKERGRNENDELINYQLCDLSLPSDELGSSSDYFMSEGERLLSHSFFMDSMRRLMGKTLTIVEASINDREQKKAVKDLVRNMFSDEMEHEGNWAYDQNILASLAEASMPEDPKDWKSVSIEEVLGVK